MCQLPAQQTYQKQREDAPCTQQHIAEMLIHVTEELYEDDEDNDPYEVQGISWHIGDSEVRTACSHIGDGEVCHAATNIGNSDNITINITNIGFTAAAVMQLLISVLHHRGKTCLPQV